jgi:hypothetical protein
MDPLYTERPARRKNSPNSANDACDDSPVLANSFELAEFELETLNVTVEVAVCEPLVPVIV